MIKIEKGLKPFYLVEIESNDKYYKISGTNYICAKEKLCDRWTVFEQLDDIYYIVCSTSELNEDIAKELVQFETSERVYRNYSGNTIDDAWDCPTAVQSFRSLLKSEGCDKSNYLILIKEDPIKSILKMFMRSEIVFIDGKVAKTKYGKCEIDFDSLNANQNYIVESFENDVLYLKSK